MVAENRTRIYKDTFFIFAMVLVILLVFRDYFVPGELILNYSLPGDSIAHAYKIETAKRMLLNDRMLIDWDDGWYNGYHPFLFYSPLGYAPYIILDIAVNDLGIALRVGIILGFVIAAIGMYFLASTLLNNRTEELQARIIAAGAALYFSLNPYSMYFVVVEGELPALYSIALMPISLILLFRLLHNGSRKAGAAYALTLGMGFLAHGHFGFLAAASGLLIFICATGRRLLSSVEIKEDGLSLNRIRNKQISRILTSYIVSILLLAGLVAFWLIPYSVYAPTMADMQALSNPYLERQSIGYLDIFRVAKAYQGTTYVGATAITIVLFSFLRRRSLRIVSCFALAFFLMWLMALGSNTPIYSLLPFGKLFYPERAISVLALLAACMLSVSFQEIARRFKESTSLRRLGCSVRHCLSLAIVVLLIAIVIFDISSSYAKAAKLSSGNPDFSNLCRAVRLLDGESEGSRTILVYSPYYAARPGAPQLEYVLFSYSPILTGKPYAYGYSFSKLGYSIDYSRTYAVALNQTKFFIGRFVDYDIQYVMCYLEDQPALNNLLDSGRFKLIDTIGNYALLSFSGRKGFIIERRADIFVIGADDYAGTVVKSVLDPISQNFTVTKGQHFFVDDYTIDDLMAHEVTVIYGVRFHDLSVAERLLSRYVSNGGFLIIDADGSPTAKGRFMGVDYHIHAFDKSSNITYSKFRLDLNPSRWTGAVYEGLDERLVVVDTDQTVIGRKNGVFFVGGNLFYHTAISSEPAQIVLLEEMITLGVDADGGRKVDFDVIRKSPNLKEYAIHVASDTMIRFSLTDSPYWTVYLDGAPTGVIDQDGFTRLHVTAGGHIVTFRYTDTAVKTMSNIVSIISLALCILLILGINLTGFSKRKKVRGERPIQLRQAFLPQ